MAVTVLYPLSRLGRTVLVESSISVPGKIAIYSNYAVYFNFLLPGQFYQYFTLTDDFARGGDSRTTLSLTICSPSFFQPDAINMVPVQLQIPGLELNKATTEMPTEVLCLLNMVQKDELFDDEEYEGKFLCRTDKLEWFPGMKDPWQPVTQGHQSVILW